MRSVQIMDKPIAPPYVCLKCGSGTDREHFVDIGLSDQQLTNKDEYGTLHQTDGLVYLCNMCMSGLIQEYMRLLFSFIEQQQSRTGLMALDKANAVKGLQDEVSSLRQIIELKDADIRKLSLQLSDKELAPVPDGSATALLANMFGADVDDTGNDNPTVDTESTDADGSNPDAEGTTENSDGDNSTDESTPSQDGYQLTLG
jgi:hypothetical protein